MLQVTWDNTQATDVTPYGITATTYDPHNLRFKVLRKRNNDESSYTTLETSSPGATNYDDGNSNGQYEGNEPYDCCPPHNYTYTYMLHALDNCVTPNEDNNSQAVTVKSHDYVAPDAPTSSLQGGAPAMYWTTDNGTTWQGPTSSFTGYVPGDKQVTLKWDPSSASDLAGYLVIGSDTDPWTPFTFQSASGDNNGTDYPDGYSFNNGKVVSKESVAQLVRTKLKDGSTDLQNGVPYYYNITAYDLAEDYDGSAGIGQQGRNYSSTLTIVATPGVSPSNVPSVTSFKNTNGITVTWTNPGESYFDGVRIAVKKHGYSSNPGDVYAFHESSATDPTTYTFDNVACPNPLDDVANDYHVTVYTYNKAADINHRRYSSGVQAGYDTTAPAPVKYFYALPSSSTSVDLNWTNPTDSDFLGVVILRKIGTSEFVYNPSDFPLTGNPYTTFTPPVGGSGISQEVVIYSGPLEYFQDTGLSSSETYYYRIWSNDDAYNYPSAYDSTAALPGGGIGGVLFAGPTTIVPGWNMISTGQQISKTLDQSTLILQGAASGDKIYRIIPGTNNYKLATVVVSNQWFDQDTGGVATWEMTPDAGYFLMRNTNYPFTWEAR